jgi:manganese transport protein
LGAAIVIVSLNVNLVFQTIQGWLQTSSSPLVLWLTVVPIACATGVLLLYIIFKPFIDKRIL